MSLSKTDRIGVVELPELGLFDPDGRNRASARPGSALISKQVLLADLRASGFDAHLVNLKDGDAAVEFGSARWGGADLTKVYLGRPVSDLDPGSVDAWAITNNFSQHRELARIVIAQLASEGRPVVVGGSDAVAEPQYYLAAGAAAAVLDKSGAANAAILAWFEMQQRAGAGSVIGASDQFLGRILKPGGRAAILDIMAGIRGLGLAVLWPNGLELKKATRGRGINRGAVDFKPDEALIAALWGWDGKVGCYHAYIPAERPVTGRENYRKLLPWREHCETVKAII